MVKVVNKRVSEYDIYIGRGSKWGNPFRLGVDGGRETVVYKYLGWLLNWILDNNERVIDGCSNRVIVESLGELEGKILGCYCKPKFCHGDILVMLVESLHL